MLKNMSYKINIKRKFSDDLRGLIRGGGGGAYYFFVSNPGAYSRGEGLFEGGSLFEDIQ